MARKLKNDFTDIIFGKLKVLKHIGNGKWLCKCECGNEKIFNGGDLKRGIKDNCGCLTKIKQSNSKKKYNIYDLSGEYGIGLTYNKNTEFYFDLEDYDKIKDYCWYEHDGYIKAGSLNRSDKNKSQCVRLHRLVMNIPNNESIKVDHIFHKNYDNRKSQLRLCNNADNCANHIIHKNNTSGKSGVNYRKDTNKWRVRIWKNWICYNIGNFNSYEDAIIARDKAENEFFKEFKLKECEL